MGRKFLPCTVAWGVGNALDGGTLLAILVKFEDQLLKMCRNDIKMVFVCLYSS